MPDSLAELARLLALRARQDVLQCAGGTFAACLRGAGLEFAELREYQPTDDARYLRWQSLDGPGPVTVRQFAPEQDTRDCLAFDVSSSMTAAPRKHRLALDTAALLAAVSILHGHGLKLVRFSNHLDSVLDLGTGNHALQRATRELFTPSPARTATDLPALLTSLHNLLAKPTRIFIVSDFLGHDYAAPLARLAARHDVTACLILPPLSDELPDNSPQDLTDAESGKTVSAAPSPETEAQFRLETRRTILAAHASCLLFDGSAPPLQTLLANLHART